MDPDMVRQQAEAELEHRMGAPLAAKGPQKKAEPEKEMASAGAMEQIAPQPTLQTAATDAAEKPGSSRWRVYLQALCSSSALAGLAGLALAAWGAHQGLSPDEQLRLGGEAAALMAVIYGIALSASGSGFTPRGRER